MANQRQILSNHFSIAHLNVKGIANKVDHIDRILHTYDLNIFGLSETFLDKWKPDRILSIPCYNVDRIE